MTDTNQLVQALSNLEVAANTVAYCYHKKPDRFSAALISLEFRADQARQALKGHEQCDSPPSS